MLHGAPGTGKTLLAKAVANESGVNFISVKGPSLISKYIGESERGIREVFKKAKQASPTILFFDEIDSLVPKRSESSTDAHVTERVISQFLTEMDGIEELKGVVVLAATNRLDLIDPALLRSGRFDILFELLAPDEETRLSIFKIHTKNRPLHKDVDLKTLAKKTNGMAGSDIQLLCQKASMNTIRKFVKGKKDGVNYRSKELAITCDDFETALRSIKSKGPEMRRLKYVPIIHTGVEMGSMYGTLKDEYIRRFGTQKWEEHNRIIEDFWQGIRNKIFDLDLDYQNTRLYQDGLPVCGKEMDIVQELVKMGSRNHQILMELIQLGAKIEGTEDPKLLLEEYDYLKKASADLEKTNK